MNQNKSKQLKRTYVTTACQNCRKRRIRCSGDVKCFECAKGRLKCEYTNPTKKRGRKPNKLVQESSSLRDQTLYEHERILEFNNNNNNNNTDLSQNSTPIIRNNLELNTLNSSVDHVHCNNIDNLSTHVLDPQPNPLILDNFSDQALDNFYLLPQSSFSTLIISLEDINLEYQIIYNPFF
ncbi:fungal specific transcription factor domain-containing protein [Gigaspora margarita]|uniref:Fungal specific transcription factor domain-containing protein n=1 Tax=Gigaspora margarita TaxID=4874 RepID=A0A8H3XAM4_GIGMA|nr:fungal specific transcription factor domain-containing protein [Gigaspora margarita]